MGNSGKYQLPGGVYNERKGFLALEFCVLFTRASPGRAADH